jgi:hypothetical protein
VESIPPELKTVRWYDLSLIIANFQINPATILSAGMAVLAGLSFLEAVIAQTVGCLIAFIAYITTATIGVDSPAKSRPVSRSARRSRSVTVIVLRSLPISSRHNPLHKLVEEGHSEGSIAMIWTPDHAFDDQTRPKGAQGVCGLLEDYGDVTRAMRCGTKLRHATQIMLSFGVSRSKRTRKKLSSSAAMASVEAALTSSSVIGLTIARSQECFPHS